jgi:hypothetical protein
MRRAVSLCRLLVLATALTAFGGTAPAAAAGTVNNVGSITNGAAELDTVIYTDTDGSKVGLLGITGADGKKISFAFRRDEWVSLIALWKQTATAPSTAWKMVGTMAETETTEPSFLIMYAGATYSIVIADPTHSEVFSLARSDGPAFETALGRVLNGLPR